MVKLFLHKIIHKKNQPDVSSKILSSEASTLLHVASKIDQQMYQNGSKMTPKWLQNGSQNDPLGPLGAHLDMMPKNYPYFSFQGSPKGPKMDPKMDKKSTYFGSYF